MPVLLSDVLKEMSKAVQTANFILDQMSADMYISQGYRKDERTVRENGAGSLSDVDNDVLTPITYSINLPIATQADNQEKTVESKQVNIPITALFHHNTMQLEEVDVTIRFESEDIVEEGLMVNLKSENAPDENSVNKITLHYRKNPAPEGIARMDTYHCQNL